MFGYEHILCKYKGIIIYYICHLNSVKENIWEQNRNFIHVEATQTPSHLSHHQNNDCIVEYGDWW